MSELKAITAYDAYWKATSNGDNSIPVYFKSEADKVIAELKADYKEACDRLKTANIEKDKEIIHHKFKRCLAMEEEWRSYAAFCGIQSSWYNNRGFGKTAEKYSWKECHAWKCMKRWLELAKKFMEEK